MPGNSFSKMFRYYAKTKNCRQIWAMIVWSDPDPDPNLRSVGSFRINRTLFCGPWLLPCWRSKKWRWQVTQKRHKSYWSPASYEKSTKVVDVRQWVYKNDFYPPYTHKGHIWIRWIQSTLLPGQGCSDPNPKDLDPDSTNRSLQIQWIRWIWIWIRPNDHGPKRDLMSPVLTRRSLRPDDSWKEKERKRT